ncbi:unnamed protein product [Calypogeia fissa]
MQTEKLQQNDAYPYRSRTLTLQRQDSSPPKPLASSAVWNVVSVLVQALSDARDELLTLLTGDGVRVPKTVNVGQLCPYCKGMIDGSTAEKFIREAFGNNPDTSKALRLLLTQRKVHRVGDGGRGKAFVYVVDAICSDSVINELDCKKICRIPNDLLDIMFILSY